MHCAAYCRRSINTEEKAKVVAAVWETEFIQIPGGASYFAQRRVEELDEMDKDDLKKRQNSIQ